MAISPNIPIHPETGYSLSRDFFQGFFYYGNNRYVTLSPGIFLGPHGNFDRDVAVRLTHVAQPFWLIALKILAIASIILPIIGLLILLDSRSNRWYKNYIINPNPWPLPQPPAPNPNIIQIFAELFPEAAPPFAPPPGPVPAPVAGPAAAQIPAGPVQDRLAEVERRYAQHVRDAEREGGPDLNGFKNRLERFKKIELAIEGGGTPDDIFDRVDATMGPDAAMFHGENADGMKGKNNQEKRARFIELVSNEIGILHTMIENTSMERVMRACHKAHPCLQGTMTALGKLMEEYNGIVPQGQNADPNKSVEDLIPDLTRNQDAMLRTNALLKAFLLQQADAQLKALELESTPKSRAALSGTDRFQKIHFTIPGILEWMERNRYVGAMTTKFTHNGVPESIYTKQIAEATLDSIYQDVLGLDEVNLEDLPEDPLIAEAEARFQENAAQAEADARMVAELLAAEKAAEAARLAAMDPNEAKRKAAQLVADALAAERLAAELEEEDARRAGPAARRK
jgi:hypothetical protein